MPSEGRRGGVLGYSNGRFVHSLDEVAKGLAAGTISRGEAIKLGGAALLGSMGLISLFPAEAEAQGLCENKPAISNRRCLSERGRCGACPFCFCAKTVSGNIRCVEVSGVQCPETDQCDSNRDCPNDEVCIQVGGCCGNPRRNACAPRCPTNPEDCPDEV
jgi:hypothetical protein